MASSLITPSRAKGKKPTIGFLNLGCSKNQVDSEVMLGTLVAGGFQLTGDARAAEVVIINTCGFIEEAKQESINSIIEHGRLKKSGSCRVLIAAGCLAQRYQGELLKELPELDGVVGTGEFGRIADICRSLLAPKARQQRLWLGQPPYLDDADTPRVRLAYGRYYIDNRTDSALVVSAEALYGQADLLTDSLPAQSITAIDEVVQGSGGHVLPSNFYRGFAVTFVDSMGNASVLYSGVRNEDWERVSTIADRTELMLVID